MKRGKPMVLVLATGVFAAALFAWQRGWPPRPALGWLQRLQPEEVTQMELVYMPQAPEERYHLLKAEEIPAAVEFFNFLFAFFLIFYGLVTLGVALRFRRITRTLAQENPLPPDLGAE